ncbi:MAG: dihydroneopterin aldolase [Bacillota bacterium]|nr:dihydroneopterin aldolase [Bacillota bacterium]
MQQPGDKIILNGMEFYAYHGVLPGEQELGQRFIVDLEISCHLNLPARLDELEETIDYSEVFQIVSRIVQEERYNLIEALAERIARVILDKYSIEEVLVRVKKPHAPLGGIFSYVGIEIRKGRSRS